jgi:sugar (pentulose or hexulose) kinase/phosphoglycerate dehydrogenase-like enzyme/ribulose-5-phosphate 4-epimerase/fuculose-1-phosphate aldolase/putative sterol carrier protein
LSSRYLLGLDAGGQSIRCLLVDIDTHQMSVARRTWSFLPVQGLGWAADIDIQACWRLVAECIKEAMQNANANPKQVLGLAVTSMRHTTILLDHKGEVIFATPNSDGRAAAESSTMGSESGPQLYQSTGRWPLPIFSAVRLLWLVNHSPGLIQRAANLLSLSDWLALQMCGEIASEASQAGESLLFDLQSRTWDWERIEGFGFPKTIIPPIKTAGTRLGELSEDAATSLGLQAGTPVVLAGADTQCGLLGLGMTVPGEVGAITGTTAPIQAIVDQPLIDPAGQLWTGHHLQPGQWILESNAGNVGDTLAWFAGFLFPDAPNPEGRVLFEADQAKPGAGGLISTLGVQVFNAQEMGVPIGHLTANPFIGGQGLDKRRNLSRALLEGLAFSLRANLDQIAKLINPPTVLKMGGGMTRSRIWCQLVSDALDLPVALPVIPECSALGAAICAGVGAGIFKDLAEGSTSLAGQTHLLSPDPEKASSYHEIFANWSRLRTSLSNSDDHAADIVLQEMMREKELLGKRPSLKFKPRILVTAQLDQQSLTMLKQLGEVQYASYREESRLLTGDDLVDALQGFHVFITEVDIVDQDALLKLPDLRVIVSCRGNAVNIDLAACTAMGIPVLNTPGRNAKAVADLALAFMLMLARRISPANAFLHQQGGEAGDMGRMGHAHELFQGIELSGKTVGLVGLGAVGRALVKRLEPYKMRLLVYDPYISQEDADRVNAEAVSLERLLEESDFVSLHAAVTEGSRGMIGTTQLSRMKKGAYLINTARAALVDEEALYLSLQTGHLGGAAIDVFSVEPPGSDDPLLALPNLIATPHIGGNTIDVAAHQGRIAFETLHHMLIGQVPDNVLNPDTIDGFSWDGDRKSVNLEATITQSLPPGSILPSGPTVSDLLSPNLISQTSGKPEPAALQPTALPPILIPLAEKPPMSIQNPPQDIRLQLEKVLQIFTSQATIDPVLIAFSAKKKITNQFTINDLGLDFYLSYQEGVVSGAVSAPPTPAEVRMKASAETFDGIFTGRINGNKAAMSGKLSFSGDVRLAMGLQRIQNDLIRLYTAAREAAGGLGDLSAIGKPTASPSVTVASSPGRESLDLRQELVLVINELYQIQLITATGGNLSVRIPDLNQAWITPSQLYKGDLKPEVMVRIDLEGNSLDPDAMAPSSERQVHTEIYKARPDVQAIIHAHAPYATILGMSGKPFLPITTEAAFIKELPRVPFIMPGTHELAQAVANGIGKNPAVIMQNHGLVVAASNLRRASNLLESIERNCQLILGCYAAGKKPPVLPKEVVKMLQDVGEMMA